MCFRVCVGACVRICLCRFVCACEGTVWVSVCSGVCPCVCGRMCANMSLSVCVRVYVGVGVGECRWVSVGVALGVVHNTCSVTAFPFLTPDAVVGPLVSRALFSTADVLPSGEDHARPVQDVRPIQTRRHIHEGPHACCTRRGEGLCHPSRRGELASGCTWREDS